MALVDIFVNNILNALGLIKGNETHQTPCQSALIIDLFAEYLNFALPTIIVPSKTSVNSHGSYLSRGTEPS